MSGKWSLRDAEQKHHGKDCSWRQKMNQIPHWAGRCRWFNRLPTLNLTSNILSHVILFFLFLTKCHYRSDVSEILYINLSVVLRCYNISVLYIEKWNSYNIFRDNHSHVVYQAHTFQVEVSVWFETEQKIWHTGGDCFYSQWKWLIRWKSQGTIYLSVLPRWFAFNESVVCLKWHEPMHPKTFVVCNQRQKKCISTTCNFT